MVATNGFSSGNRPHRPDYTSQTRRAESSGTCRDLKLSIGIWSKRAFKFQIRRRGNRRTRPYSDMWRKNVKIGISEFSGSSFVHILGIDHLATRSLLDYTYVPTNLTQ